MWKLKRRIKDERGNATIVLGILLITSLLLVGGLLLDISKAYQLKSSYVDAGKKATQAAVMKQSSEGFLLPEAAGEAILRYESIKNSSVIKKGSALSKCSTHGDDKVIYRVYFKKEGNSVDIFIGEIPRTRVAGKTAQGITDVLIPNREDQKLIRTSGYKSIRLDVTEATQNVILPGAFTLTKAPDGEAESMQCQLLNISARANIFIGNKEETYD